MPGELWAADREELRDTGDTADFADTAAAPAGPDCTRVTGRCAATRAGLCEDTPDADVPEAVAVSAVVVSAEAAPAPASAAPTPRVTAPTPSQAYGTLRRRDPPRLVDLEALTLRRVSGTSSD